MRIFYMALVGLLLGVGAGYALRAIAAQSRSSLRTAVYGCLVGVGAMACAAVAGYFIFA